MTEGKWLDALPPHGSDAELEQQHQTSDAMHTVNTRCRQSLCLPIVCPSPSPSSRGPPRSRFVPGDSAAELLQRLPSLQVCLVHISQLSGQAGVSEAGAPTLHRGPCSRQGKVHAALQAVKVHGPVQHREAAMQVSERGVQAGPGRLALPPHRKDPQIERLAMRRSALSAGQAGMRQALASRGACSTGIGFAAAHL